jgi:hypothetical protein
MAPMVMAPLAVMVPPRPEVEVNPWVVVVPAVRVSRTVPMAAMPEAAVPRLFDGHALAGYWLEGPSDAGR